MVSGASVATVLAFALAAPLHAQRAGSPTPGDRVVYSIGPGTSFGSDGVDNFGLPIRVFGA